MWGRSPYCLNEVDPRGFFSSVLFGAKEVSLRVGGAKYFPFLPSGASMGKEGKLRCSVIGLFSDSDNAALSLADGSPLKVEEESVVGGESLGGCFGICPSCGKICLAIDFGESFGDSATF